MKEVLHTERLTIGYKDHTLLSEMSLQLNEGDIVALAGPNGAGKTTLFRTLSGNIKPLAGKVVLYGKNLECYSPTERASLFGLVLTDKPDDLFLKVADIVATGRYPHLGLMARMKDHDRDLIEASLETVGILHLAQRKFISLSDGEKQKVMIAKALAQDAPLIFMDEPTAFLDYPSKIELFTLMLKLSHQQGKTILFSSHDMDLLLRYSDKMWILGHQKPLLEGTPQQLAAQGVIDDYFKPIEARREFPFLFK